jgi:hypothetical protein
MDTGRLPGFGERWWQACGDGSPRIVSVVWLWVFVFGGIALAGLVMLVCYAVWLAHKTADVMSELKVLADRTGRIADLLGAIDVAQLGAVTAAGDPRIVEDRDDGFV